MGDIECSDCGKSTLYGGSTCLTCLVKSKTIHTSTPKTVASYASRSYGGMTYPSYMVDETVGIHTWGGTSTKIPLAAEAEAEAEAEKTEYETLHEDLRNLRDQSKLSALKQLHETLSAEHDRWVDKYTSGLGDSKSSNYISGVISGIGEAMNKVDKMIKAIENDA